MSSPIAGEARGGPLTVLTATGRTFHRQIAFLILVLRSTLWQWVYIAEALASSLSIVIIGEWVPGSAGWHKAMTSNDQGRDTVAFPLVRFSLQLSTAIV